MTKRLPTGCIKDYDDISWKTFNFLLENVSFEDALGHLYIVDIEFDTKSATETELAYNEIYPPIIEKQRTINPCERFVFQLLELLELPFFISSLVVFQPHEINFVFKFNSYNIG